MGQNWDTLVTRGASSSYIGKQAPGLDPHLNRAFPTKSAHPKHCRLIPRHSMGLPYMQCQGGQWVGSPMAVPNRSCLGYDSQPPQRWPGPTSEASYFITPDPQLHRKPRVSSAAPQRSPWHFAGPAARKIEDINKNDFSFWGFTPEPGQVLRNHLSPLAGDSHPALE